MFLKQYKHLYIWFVMVAFLSFFTVYIYMSVTAGDKEENIEQTVVTEMKKSILPEMKVYLREQYEICKEHGLSCWEDTLLQGAARRELDNLSESEVLARYPEAAGWKVLWQKDSLVLVRIKTGLCPLHQKMWHLEVDEDGRYIEIYSGPSAVGKDGGLYRQTGIEIAKLPAEIQNKIREGLFEFISWDELVAILDSFSE